MTSVKTHHALINASTCKYSKLVLAVTDYVYTTSCSSVVVLVSQTLCGPQCDWTSLPGCNSISRQHEGLFPLRQTVISPDARVEAARRRPRWTGSVRARAVTPVACRVVGRDHTTEKPAEDSRIPTSDHWPRAAQLQHSALRVRMRTSALASAVAVTPWVRPGGKLLLASLLTRWYGNDRWHARCSGTRALARGPHQSPGETYSPVTQKTTSTPPCAFVTTTNRK